MPRAPDSALATRIRLTLVAITRSNSARHLNATLRVFAIVFEPDHVTTSSRQEMAVGSFPEYVFTAASAHNDDVHQNQHQIVMPSRSLFSPEAGVPNEDLLLNRSQH